MGALPGSCQLDWRRQGETEVQEAGELMPLECDKFITKALGFNEGG